MDLVVGNNTYFGLDEANEIIENIFIDTSDEYTTWNSLSDNNKKVLIAQQTRLFESLPWLGRKYETEQKLTFPILKDGVKVELSDTGKEAIMRSLIDGYRYSNSGSAKYISEGIKSISIEGSSMSFNTENIGISKDSNLIILKKYIREVMGNYMLI